MPTFSFTYEDEILKAETTITSADSLRGMCRSRLRLGGKDAVRGRDKTFQPMAMQQDADALLLYTYPDLIASLVRMTLWRKDADGKLDEIPRTFTPDTPLGFKDYLELPYMMALEWESHVYRLNPWWLAKTPDQVEEDSKKAEPSTAD